VLDDQFLDLAHALPASVKTTPVVPQPQAANDQKDRRNGGYDQGQPNAEARCRSLFRRYDGGQYEKGAPEQEGTRPRHTAAAAAGHSKKLCGQIAEMEKGHSRGDLAVGNHFHGTTDLLSLNTRLALRSAVGASG
jgi:hypothetical protein